MNVPLRAVLAALAFNAAIVPDAPAADWPQPREGTWVAPEFRFHTGEVMRDVKLHYRTIGDPSGTTGTRSRASPRKKSAPPRHDARPAAVAESA